MTATIRETNVFSDTFRMLNGHLATISDPGGKSKWVFASFPEGKVDQESDYPLIIVGHTDVSYNPLTFINIKRGPVRFAIDVFSVSSKQLDEVSDLVADKMETSEGDFQTSGVTTMRLVSTTYSQFSRNTLRIHNKALNYEFDFGWY